MCFPLLLHTVVHSKTVNAYSSCSIWTPSASHLLPLSNVKLSDTEISFTVFLPSHSSHSEDAAATIGLLFEWNFFSSILSKPKLFAAPELMYLLHVLSPCCLPWKHYFPAVTCRSSVVFFIVLQNEEKFGLKVALTAYWFCLVRSLLYDRPSGLLFPALNLTFFRTPDIVPWFNGRHGVRADH